MIEWPIYNISLAEEDFNKISIVNITKPNLSKDFQVLRDNLIEKRDYIFDKYKLDDGMQEYVFDLNFGLALYEILSDLSPRDAANDDVWRYISVKVIPDIVHSRWGFQEGRFYKENRRIWLKQLWWYIHLSWTGKAQSTYDILKNNTTDTIQSVVERPGLGYNVRLYREIMLQYSKFEDRSRMLLRRIMVLNTARVKLLSPELTEQQVKGYVSSLFEAVV